MDTALFLLVYFLPAIVGIYRKHHRAWVIFALNLLLGWTVTLMPPRCPVPLPCRVLMT